MKNPETKHKWYGSGVLKQERSAIASEDDEWRTSKVAKTDHDMSSASKAMLFQQRNNSLLRSNATLFSDGHHHQSQMLSFSSPKSESLLVDKASSNATLPFSYHQLSSNTRNAGYSSGSISMHGALAGVRGPFTPSQWMELEHQALIYKYITSNAQRMCRRTDGKKWRCSRDAVVDQKYCERHMNRGRHRSRKPVEGQLGHALTTTTTTNTPNASSNSTVVPRNTTTTTTTFAHNNVHHPLPPHSSQANTINRMFTSNKENNSTSERLQDPALPMLPPTLELKPKENNPFMIHKHHIPADEYSRNSNEFGLVTSDSLLNPTQKRSFTSSQKDDSESQQQHSLRHFIDDSPKPQSHNHHHHHHSSSIWPELDSMQSDRTQLSISIPISSSDFMSFTTSSPSNEKLTLSPLGHSRELDPIQMELGMGSGASNEANTRQANWIPITWESSMGGPLGEVLNLSNNSNASDQCGKNNNTSALNLMKDGWDNNPPLGSSPTGVLQKSAFGSLSNSSAGSSPRAENNKEGATLCNAL
ncbi:Growth-regulating factor 1 [Glycine soja]